MKYERTKQCVQCQEKYTENFGLIKGCNYPGWTGEDLYFCGDVCALQFARDHTTHRDVGSYKSIRL